MNEQKLKQQEQTEVHIDFFLSFLAFRRSKYWKFYCDVKSCRICIPFSLHFSPRCHVLFRLFPLFSLFSPCEWHCKSHKRKTRTTCLNSNIVQVNITQLLIALNIILLLSDTEWKEISRCHNLLNTYTHTHESLDKVIIMEAWGNERIVYELEMDE